jgi:hypothetical protein
VVIHPRDGALSLSGDEVPDYYDSNHHSAAVAAIAVSGLRTYVSGDVSLMSRDIGHTGPRP